MRDIRALSSIIVELMYKRTENSENPFKNAKTSEALGSKTILFLLKTSFTTLIEKLRIVSNLKYFLYIPSNLLSILYLVFYKVSEIYKR